MGDVQGRASEGEHAEFSSDANVFEQLARLSVADKNKAVLGELIKAQTKQNAEIPRLDFYRGELAGMNENWPEAAEAYRAALATIATRFGSTD